MLKKSLRNLVLVLICGLLVSACSQKEEEPQRVQHLKVTFNMVETAIQDPSLQSLAQSIEEVEYNPDGVLSVMFSPYGAGVWPPPDVPSDIQVVRNEDPAPWTVVISTDEKGFTLSGYGQETDLPEIKSRIAFPPKG